MKKITNTILSIMAVALMITSMRVMFELAKEVSTIMTGISFVFVSLFMTFLLYALCMIIVGLWTNKKYQ